MKLSYAEIIKKFIDKDMRFAMCKHFLDVLPADAPKLEQLAEYISQMPKFNIRKETFLRKDTVKKATMMAETLASFHAQVLDDIMSCYLRDRKYALLVEWLNALGIKHTRGNIQDTGEIVQLSADSVLSAAEGLLKDYALKDVILCFGAFASDNLGATSVKDAFSKFVDAHWHESPEDGDRAISKSDNAEIDAFLKKIVVFERRMKDLALEMRAAANDMLEFEIPPSEWIDGEILTLRKDIEEFTDDILKKLEQLGEQGTPTALGHKKEDLPKDLPSGSLLTLKYLLQRASEILCNTPCWRSALAILEEIERLAVENEKAAELLKKIQEKAKNLKKAATDKAIDGNVADELASLGNGSHAFCEILDIVNERKRMEWNTMNIVAKAYGEPLAEALLNKEIRVLQHTIEDLTIKTLSGKKEDQSESSEISPAITIGNGTEPIPQANGQIAPSQPTDSAISGIEIEDTEIQVIPVQEKQSGVDIESLQPFLHEGEDVEVDQPIIIGGSSSETATLAKEHGTLNEKTVSGLIWQLIGEDKVPLAYHLSRYAEESFGTSALFPSSSLLLAAALAPSLTQPNGPIAAQLKTAFEDYMAIEKPRADKDTLYAYGFLAAAAAMRPSLLSPASGAVEVMREVPKEGFQYFAKLSQAILEYGSKHLPLDPYALKKARAVEQWREGLSTVALKAQRWLKEAVKIPIKYYPATRVKNAWLKREGLIGRLMHIVERNDSAHVEEVLKLVEQISDEAAIRNFISATDKKESPSRTGEPICGDVQSKLIYLAQEAYGIASEWLAIHRADPTRENDYVAKQTIQLREALFPLCKVTAEELRGLATSGQLKIAAAAAQLAAKAVDNMRNLLDETQTFSLEEHDWRFLLNKDMFRVRGISLTHSFEPLQYRSDLLAEGLLELIAKYDESTWQLAYDIRAEMRDHESTEQILDYLEMYNQLPKERIESLRERRHKEVRDCRASLQSECDQILMMIEDAFLLKLLTMEDWERYRAIVQDINRANTANELLNFHEVRTELRRVAEKIETQRRAESGRIMEALQQTNLSPDSLEFKTIVNVIEKGDLLV